VVTSTTSTATFIVWNLTTGRRPPEEPPAGALAPAPEPFPPGPLRWDAVRLDAPIGALP
jgi:hypothetical protein